MHLLEFNGIDGDYVEFGCDGAQTFRLAHRFSRDLETHRHLWANLFVLFSCFSQ